MSGSRGASATDEQLSLDADAIDGAAQPLAGSADGPSPATTSEPPGPRSVESRLARLHLRGGMLALARAELEQMAGAGALDTPALADLAEARWRSGDLLGAAEPAQAHLDAGGSEPIAMLIRAETLEAAGRRVEARALAAQVLERVGGQVERLFAGEPRSGAWSSAGSTPTPLEPGTVPWGALVGGPEVYDPDPEEWHSSVAPEAEAKPDALWPDTAESPGTDLLAALAPGRAATVDEVFDAGRAAGRELESIEDAVGRGDISGVAERLSLLLRMDPGFAAIVLSHADRALEAAGDDASTGSALQIVRGDAFRVLGRETDATGAYQSSARAVAARPHTSEETS